jgi:thiamine biosynthesis protein ThiI
VIDCVTDKLVLRPLIASHKQDIIDQANEIGTADFAKHMPEYCGVISVNPKTPPSATAWSTKKRVRHGGAGACARERQTGADRSRDRRIGPGLQIEEVSEALAGQIVIDIRHPDAAEDEPLELAGIEVQTMPFYAMNARFKELDPLASTCCIATKA